MKAESVKKGAAAPRKKRSESAPPEPPGKAAPGRGVVARLWWCLLAGVLVFTSFPFRTVPDSNLWPLVWVGLVPLLWAIEGVKPRTAFWLGWAMGTVTNVGGFYWIAGLLMEFGHLPAWAAWPICVLNAAYQGLQFALFAWLLTRLKPGHGDPPSVLRVAAVFTAVELVFPMIFPWYLGNSQYRFLPAIQIAELTGAPGVTFVVVLANAALYRVLLTARGLARPAWRQVGVAGGLVAATLVYGVVRVGQVDAQAAEADKLKLGLVEANIGIWEKEARGLSARDQALTIHGNLLRHQRMTRALAEQGVDLVLWPESSYFPLGDVFVKRTTGFAAGVTDRGQLVAWRELDADGAEGMQWTLERTPPGEGALNAVAAAREDAVVAVGQGGRALFGDGSRFAQVPTSTTADLYGVVAVPDQGWQPFEDRGAVRIWAVGEGGALLTGTPAGLERVSTGVTTPLRALAMVDAQTGIAVGDGGVVVAMAPGAAAPMEGALGVDLFAAWAGSEGKRVWAAGGEGAVFRLEAREWQREDTGVTSTLRAFAGPAFGAAGPTWVVGDGGAVLRRAADGTWTREVPPTAADLVSATLDARGTLLVGARDGSLWRRTGPGAWQRLETPGLGAVRGLAPLPFVRTSPMPKDVRYVYQSDLAIPDDAAYRAEPWVDLERPLADRTAVQRDARVPILFGGLGRGDGKVYNTAFMLDARGRVVGAYDKVYLLVFGEYIPLSDTFPFLHDWIPEAGDFSAGNSATVLQWGDHRLGVMICYEDILPEFNRRLADKRPNVLLNITNDAWFGRTSEPHLHLALSTFRAVESRLSLVRSTNTGVSAVVDPTGRIAAQTSIDDPETLVHDVPLMPGGTPFTRVGDAFGYAMLVWVGLVALARVRRQGRAHR